MNDFEYRIGQTSSHRYFLTTNNNHCRTDLNISSTLGMSKLVYQECLISLGGFRAKNDNEVYFRTYEEAELILEWVDSVRVINKLAGY